jgi:hypothetical protein
VGGGPDRVDLATSLVPVLPQHTVSNFHSSRPVLRVDDEEPSWPDQDVVDVRFRSAGPRTVIEAQVTICGQLVESLSNGRLTYAPSGECSSAPLVGLGTLPRLVSHSHQARSFLSCGFPRLHV